MIRTAEVQGRLDARGRARSPEEQMTLLERSPAPGATSCPAWSWSGSRATWPSRTSITTSSAACSGPPPARLPTAAALAAPPRRPAEAPRSNPYSLQEIDRQLEAFHALIQFRHDMIQELRA